MYVDDLLIRSKSKQKMKSIKRLLSERFEIKDIGEIKEYLGINVSGVHIKLKESAAEAHRLLLETYGEAALIYN